MAEQPEDRRSAREQDRFSNEIDLFELAEHFWRDKWVISAFTCLAAFGSIFYAISLPNIYQATALLKPQGSEGAARSIASQYGNLAGLAGISLPSGSGTTKALLAMEVLKSRRFASEFTTRHDVLPALIAGEKWDWESETLSLNPSIYDSVKGTWVGKASPSWMPTPSSDTVHAAWNAAVSIVERKDTGFLALSFKHRSPVYAKQWLDLLIVDINETLRAQDLGESSRAIAYLEDQLKETKVAEIRELLASLLRSHMESRMMATVEPNYVFAIVDPPTLPEKKAEPKRALICIFGTLIGFALGVSFSLVMHAARSRPKSHAK